MPALEEDLFLDAGGLFFTNLSSHDSPPLLLLLLSIGLRPDQQEQEQETDLDLRFFSEKNSRFSEFSSLSRLPHQHGFPNEVYCFLSR